MAGYSGTPLARKLGIRPCDQVRAINAPCNYHDLLAGLPEGVSFLNRLVTDTPFINGLVTTRRQLDGLLVSTRRHMARDGMLWVSWPKKSSGKNSEVSEKDVRVAGLAAGLVDVKICAVDETWSGLKFVYRLADR